MTGWIVPNRPMRMQMASKAQDDSGRYERIPASLRQKMMAFQREGVRFALAHGGRVLIGDEMGAANRRRRCCPSVQFGCAAECMLTK